jgi:putative DNA primase/helicase
MSSISEFHTEMRLYGLQPPNYIEPSKLHRFPGRGKGRGNKSGWCVLFHDGAGGSFGDWSTGLNENWQAQRESTYTVVERAEFMRQVAAARAAEQAARAAQHREAASKANAVIQSSKPAMFHPYLQAKKVLPLGILENDNYLVIPMQDIDGKVWSLQTIKPNGTKQFMAGGRIKDSFYLIGGPVTDQVFICEGFATGASLHMHGGEIGSKGQPIVVAFNVGNLKGVAMAFRHKYPGINITIAADNDTQTQGNPGLTKGQEAAGLVGGGIIWPSFDGESFTGSDFNDYVNGGGKI